MLTKRNERLIYLRVLAPLLLAIVTLVFVSVGGVRALSASRAYVGGESLWSKASGRAIAALRVQVAANDPSAAPCASMAESLGIPNGDHDARIALEQPEPDLAAARAGFMRGGNLPDDIDGLIQLYLAFGTTPLMRDAIEAWREGDALLAQLRALAERVCAARSTADNADARAADLRALDKIDNALFEAESRFSSSLARASRQAELLLTGAITVLGVLLAGACAWYLMRSVSAQLAQRRALVDANARWDLAAEAAGIGIFMWQPSGDQMELDQRARLLHGFSPDDTAAMTGRELNASIHPDDREAVSQLALSAAESAEPLRVGFRVVMPDGEIRHLEAIGMLRDAVQAGDRLQMFGVVRDVTDEIAAQRMQLERDAAERSARARSEFLSRLSHELRTPLNAVLGLAQVLEVDNAEPLGPQQRQRVQLILQSGWHLLHLVDDVLDITSIDAGMLAVQPVPTDLRAAMRASLALVEPERARADVQVDDHWPADVARVMADPPRLQQVFANLLSNACKYNTRGGQLTLGYSHSATEVCITITDQGRGIAPDELAELFQPFKRLASAADVHGTGLGLVIVKLLTEQMGGRIEVTSEPGQGACFIVWLRRA